MISTWLSPMVSSNFLSYLAHQHHFINLITCLNETFLSLAFQCILLLWFFSYYPEHSSVSFAGLCHSSTLAWKIPWMEEPGRLQSMGSLRVGHDWATSLSLFTCMHWRRKWQPTPVLLPGESPGRGSWWAAVYRVAQSRTRLDRLSSSIDHLQSV